MSDFEKKLQYAHELIEKYGLEGAIKIHVVRTLISLGLVLIAGIFISCLISFILIGIL
jgi:hypothetical protein